MVKHLGIMIQKVVFDASDNSIQVRPRVTTEQVKEIALSCFGLEVDPDSLPKELNSYDDRNMLIQGEHFFKYTFNLIFVEIITRFVYVKNLCQVLDYSFKLPCTHPPPKKLNEWSDLP